GAHRVAGRRPGGVRALLPYVLDLPRTSRALPRGPLRAPRRTGVRRGARAARRAGAHRRGPRLRAARVVGARLERAGDRLLPRARRRADERLDRVPRYRRAARAARRPL
ncbi:MAG: hypothetical protein AVDCRST_MAG40-1256, partial [uncultured Gemmatimonadaceae bacterium]